MKEDESCPDCGTAVGPAVARVSHGERQPENKVRMCLNVHCDYMNEVTA